MILKTKDLQNFIRKEKNIKTIVSTTFMTPDNIHNEKKKQNK
jgi:hypothetical protein